MLYFKFNGVEGFKETFGWSEHGNGVKSRRNKILLALMRSREFWKGLRNEALTIRRDGRAISGTERNIVKNWFYNLHSMDDLRKTVLDCLRIFSVGGYDCALPMNERTEYQMRHPIYEVSNGGLCFDGDVRSIRYINHESDHIYKMKAGKFMRSLIDNNQFGRLLPEQVRVWICEDFCEKWQSWAQSKVTGYTLHVEDTEEAFNRIYDCENYLSDFGSCMSHDGGDHSQFYVNAVKAKAAWLENEDGVIVARCVIFTDVTDENGKKWRLAERQYSANGDNVLKNILIDKLIAMGEIDGYKRIGAGCGDANAFVTNAGDSLADKRFSISCELYDEDYLAYQDSFKWYCEEDNTAYNYPEDGANVDLADTSMFYHGHRNDVWSDYNNEYIPSDEATYVDSREDYFWSYQTRYCVNTETDEYRDDCVQLHDGDYAYAGEDCDDPEGNGVSYCECCGQYFLEEDIHYSEMLDQMLCDECLYRLEQRYMRDHSDEGLYRFDQYDDEWYEVDKWQDVRVLVWNGVKRVWGYTRKKNIEASSFYKYHRNWYYCHSHMMEDGSRMPHELWTKIL